MLVDYDLPNEGSVIEVNLISELDNAIVFLGEVQIGEVLFDFKTDETLLIDGHFGMQLC